MAVMVALLSQNDANFSAFHSITDSLQLLLNLVLSCQQIMFTYILLLTTQSNFHALLDEMQTQTSPKLPRTVHSSFSIKYLQPSASGILYKPISHGIKTITGFNSNIYIYTLCTFGMLYINVCSLTIKIFKILKRCILYYSLPPGGKQFPP